jgi:hypothetical protein
VILINPGLATTGPEKAPGPPKKKSEKIIAHINIYYCKARPRRF